MSSDAYSGRGNKDRTITKSSEPGGGILEASGPTRASRMGMAGFSDCKTEREI